MKKRFTFALAVVVLLCCLVGCNNGKEIVLTDEDIHTDYAGVYLTLSSVDSSGEHKKLNAVWHNETTKTVTYGNWFMIEKKDGENWTDVSIADVEFTEEVYVLEANKTNEKSYTTMFADISGEGTYRVRTAFYVQESDGTSKGGTTWVEFEIKAASSIKSYTVTVEDGDEYLYENLNRKYKEGEQVVVKTHILTDASLTVYMNGESLGTGEAIKTNDRYTHWEYYFTMPSEDVTLTFEVKDGFLVDRNNWDEGIAWVNCGGNDAFYSGALNSDKFSTSSVEHLPIYKFDSLSELNQFKTTFADVFSFHESYDEIQSFETAIQDFDDDFFAEYSLFVVYVSSNSGSLRFGVNSVYNDGDDFCIYIEQLNNPENVTDDMAGWFILLPQLQSMVEGCSTFDAQSEIKAASSIKSYTVTVEDGDEYLYENLNRKYKEGEQVVVKTHILTDVSLTVYMNGESLGTGEAIKTNDQYTHWEYYFTMPSEDVTLTFEVKDGMLPPALRDEALGGCDVAWANYAEGDYIEDALNFDKFGLASGQKPDANHLPIYKFSTLAEFEAFKIKYAETFEMNSAYDEVRSFAEVTEYMAENEGYWNTYDLCVIYVMTNTCSTRYGLTDVVTDGTKVCFYVNLTYDPGDSYDEAMSGWFIITSLPKDMIADYTEYDAVTGNP